MILKKLLRLGATLAAFSALPALAQTEMHVASWLPPTHPHNAVVLPTWGQWIEEATEGRVTLKIDYDLGHPKDMFTLVEDGVADAGWSFHGYVPGRFQLTQIVEQPLLGANAEAASVAYWRVYEKYLKPAEEHIGLEVVGLFTHAPGQIQMAEPIQSLAELAGKKIRLGGGIQSALGERMQVTPVNAPATKVYEMMQQGVIDGAFMPLCEQKVLRLSEVADNLTLLPGGMYLGSFGIFINPDFLEDLTDEDREAILSVSGEKLSQLAGRVWDQCGTDALAASREAGVNVVEVAEGEPMAEEFRQLAEGLDEAWFKQVEGSGVDTKAALAELREIARNY
ncbi:ABC transporter substrate-binding protein [Marinobacterium nitratireducens]|uniref:ABC transporter substrate-binding protein n=1 Tax=Marinobacterium nitratireducens TaxID=518897 RepID=A0A917ZAH7_9GAMM|nr:TRAP transporter substrate-binding protein [Marinobacterium nitratireducens]GGO79196.1 ABC transporter substrate-binding protein [Marinobacterium nitratireducens]